LAIIIAAALAVLAPELVTGLTVTDNFRFNLLWPQQFADLFRAGHLYPRWLPSSWHGLGSPNFYFYPPLFFWVTAVVDGATGGMLPAERFVPFASLVILIASGLSMRWWLLTKVNSRRASAGAIAYMLAPYHLYDLYGRGALAEASAYASVPVIVLALARLGDNRTVYLPVLAIAYCALLLSNLPAALLVSVFLIPAYVLFVAGRSSSPLRFVTQALIGGMLGLSLAAIYLVPAIMLLPYVSSQALSGSFYRPENWFFWNLHAGTMAGRMYLIAPICVAASLLAGATMVGARFGRADREPLFWAALTMILVALIAGLVPCIWKIPELRFVQFPWRMLFLVEFAVVTMLVMGVSKPRNILVLAGLATLGFAYAVLGLITSHMIGRTWDHRPQIAAEIRAAYLDAPEYLPAGTRIEQGQGPDDVRIGLPRLPFVAAAENGARLAVSEEKDGGLTVKIDSPAPTRLTLRRSYFPHWQLHDWRGQEVLITPERRMKVVTFAAPAGASSFRLEVGLAPYERAGELVTLAAIACLVLTVATLRMQNGPQLGKARPIVHRFEGTATP
jgi:hypothetical protein